MDFLTVTRDQYTSQAVCLLTQVMNSMCYMEKLLLQILWPPGQSATLVIDRLDVNHAMGGSGKINVGYLYSLNSTNLFSGAN